ncbi:MAG: hypothetical protein U0871_23380 [Gemmataceae bacterium]
MTESETSRLLFNLLFDALLELRARGWETNDPVVAKLADLFHNIPLGLHAATEGRRSFADVLDELRRQGQADGTSQWLDRQIDWQQARTAPSSQPVAAQAG